MLVDPYQPAAIAAAMGRLAADADARAALRQAGLQRAQQFDWAETGRRTASVLGRFL